MPEAKPAAKVPRRTREERDPARDGASTGGAALLAYFGVTRKGRSRPYNGDSLPVAQGATPGSTAKGGVSGGVRFSLMPVEVSISRLEPMLNSTPTFLQARPCRRPPFHS